MIKKVIFFVLLLALGVAIGRASAPVKVVTETKTVEVVKVVTVEAAHKETRVTERQKPDGSKETTTVVVEDRKTDTVSQADKSAESSKTVVKANSNVSLAALAGAPLSLSGGIGAGAPVYGLHVSKALIGPITIGVFGFTSGLAGVSVGVNF